MKFKIEWIYFGQVFLGIGIVFGKEYIGLTLGNLFIGIKSEIKKPKDMNYGRTNKERR